MQKKEIPDETGVLDLLTQPVFYVEAARIVFRNHAAARLTAPDLETVDALLGPEDLEAYRAFRGDGALELTLLLGGRPFRAAVLRTGRRDVFVAQETPLLADLRLETLTVAARNLRRQLSELFDAAAVLFPLLEEEQDDPRLRQQAARVNRSLHALLRLTVNLSDAERYMTDGARVCLERMELSEFLAALCERTAPLCAAAGVTLEYRRPPQPVSVSADRQKLERALLNLLSNALRFTPAGGAITVSLEANASRAYLRVADTGEGIEPAVLAQVFNRYERAEDPAGDPRQRMGLGLPLVQMIAQLHGGTVVVNAAPGGGTVATMSVARRLDPDPMEEVHSPVRGFDYAGGCDHALLELADALPPEVFAPGSL